MDPEGRATAPAHATGAVDFVSIDDISDDGTFRLRLPGDVTLLAASIGRLGQLLPVELRPLPPAATAARPEGGGAGSADPEDGFLPEVPLAPRWQVVAGFRRIEALRMLQRDRVLARIHAELDDEDAWALALSRPLLSEPYLASELEALRERIAGVAPWAEELVEEALVRAPVSTEERERFADFLEASRRGEVALSRAGPGGPGGEGEEGEPETVELTPEELALHLAVRIFELNQELAAGWEAWRELPAEGRRQIVEQARYLAELFPLMDRETE